MIKRTVVTRFAEKQISKLPYYISKRLAAWIEDVGDRGLEEVRKIPGYHDEPLHGDRKGQRSIRLNISYRAIYVVLEDNTVQFVSIEEVSNMTINKKSKALRFLEKVAGRPFKLSGLIESLRLCEEMSQVEFAKKLGISPSHLCDIEKGRKLISPERAAKFAEILGMSPQQFVRLSIQEMIDNSGLNMKVNISAG